MTRTFQAVLFAWLLCFCTGARAGPSEEPAPPDDPQAVTALEQLGAKLSRSPDGHVYAVEWHRLGSISMADVVRYKMPRRLWYAPIVARVIVAVRLLPFKGPASVHAVHNKGRLVTDDLLRHLAGLRQLEWLDLSGTAITDRGLAQLDSLSDLRWLSLGGTDVTDEGLWALHGLRDLYVLELEGTKISQEGADSLLNWIPKLLVKPRPLPRRAEAQDISALKQCGARIALAPDGHADSLFFSDATRRPTDADLAHVAKLTHLKELSLENGDVTDAGIERLSGLTRLQWLDLEHTDLTDGGLKHLVQMQSLEDLNLDGTAVTDAGVAYLKSLGGLNRLRCHGTRISRQGQEDLHEALPGLAIDPKVLPAKEILDAYLKLQQWGIDVSLDDEGMARNIFDSGPMLTDERLVQVAMLGNLECLNLEGARITDAGLVQVAKLKGLTMLSLRNTRISDAGLAHLAKLNKLEWLALEGTHVSDAGLRHLAGIATLRWLGLERTEVSENGIRELQRQLPDCHIGGATP